MVTKPLSDTTIETIRKLAHDAGRNPDEFTLMLVDLYTQFQQMKPEDKANWFREAVAQNAAISNQLGLDEQELIEDSGR